MLSAEGRNHRSQNGAWAGLVRTGAVDTRTVELLPGVAQDVLKAERAAGERTSVNDVS